ncbi:histone deacetylase family protein [Leptothrix sp. BB-4]
MQLHYSDHFVLPLPEGHRFPMRKYRDLHDALAVSLPQARFVEAPAATPGELALAHGPSYVDAVLHGHLSAAQQREIGFPWSPQMAERARRSVGATIAAARAALAEGISANLAGGTHHASADGGSGFCVFNDVAVAARLMQAEVHRQARRLLRVAVIDLDVHQGNGTAAIFADDPTVWTLSLHGQHNFPFRKVPGDDDVALPDGCDDAAYLDALDAALKRLWARHADAPPGLVFYIAGADVHEGDRLGRLKLSDAGVAERDRRVYTALRERGIPVAVSMGGGYGVDLARTVAVQRRTLELAWDDWQLRRAAERR